MTTNELTVIDIIEIDPPQASSTGCATHSQETPTPTSTNSQTCRPPQTSPYPKSRPNPCKSGL
jgi:hypothetical protein